VRLAERSGGAFQVRSPLAENNDFAGPRLSGSGQSLLESNMSTFDIASPASISTDIAITYELQSLAP